MIPSKRRSQETYYLFIDNVTPATRLLEKRRYMFEVQEALDAYKEEFARREEAFRRREESLRKKDLNLQTSLINYNKIITNNEAKRYRALYRRMYEEKARQLKEREIERLRHELQHQEDELTAMKQDLDRVVRYRKYLKTVQETYPDEFPEIDTIETRYTKLEKYHGVLEAEQSANYTHLQQVRRAIDHLSEDGSSRQLMQTLQAATLSKAYESYKVAADSLVRSETEAAARHSTRTSETGIVLAAVRNVFQRCTGSGMTSRLKHEHDIMRDTTQRGGGLPSKSPSKPSTASTAGPKASAASPMRRAGAAVTGAKSASKEAAAAVKSRTSGGETEEQRLRRLASAAEKELQVVGAYVSDFQEIVRRWRRDKRWYLANVGAGGGGGGRPGAMGQTAGGSGGVGATVGRGRGVAGSRAASGAGGIGGSGAASLISGTGISASESSVPGFSSAGRGTFAGTVTAAAGNVKTQPGVFFMKGATRIVAARQEAKKHGKAGGGIGSRTGGGGAGLGGSSIAGSSVGGGGGWGEGTAGGASVSMSGSRFSGSEFG